MDAKAEGKASTILFNLSGHGHFDMQSYIAYQAGKLVTTVSVGRDCNGVCGCRRSSDRCTSNKTAALWKRLFVSTIGCRGYGCTGTPWWPRSAPSPFPASTL